MFITLTELRYVVALAQEGHFGRAADKCFVSQPTLSIAIKKLEDNLGLQIFERSKNSIIVTTAGAEIIARAQGVIESVKQIEDFAKCSHDTFATPLKLGAIHTVGPYLFPGLISHINQAASKLKLIMQEDFTENLTEKLSRGILDAIIVAKPYERPNILTTDLYTEEFNVIMPAQHAWKNKKKITPHELNQQTLLILSSGNCFRDQVLKICPQCNMPQADGNTHAIITSSIETIKYMVAGNIGISIVPERALNGINSKAIVAKPFAAPAPQREIVLAYRSGLHGSALLTELVQLIRNLDT